MRRILLAALLATAVTFEVTDYAHSAVGIKPLACENSSDTGDVIDLAGAAAPFLSFLAAGYASGDQFYYQLTNGDGEVAEGLGTFTDATPDTFDRDNAEHSSDGVSTPLTLTGTVTICAGLTSGVLTAGISVLDVASITIDGEAYVRANWNSDDTAATKNDISDELEKDHGDVTVSGSTWSVDADSVALTTDTTGNYAAGDAEAGAATSGDSATSFWSTGTCEVARGCTGQASVDEALGEMIQAATAQATVESGEDYGVIYDADDDTGKKVLLSNWPASTQTDALIVAVSGELQTLTTGTDKVTVRAPYAMTVTGVRCAVNTAGTALTVDINESNTSILSTKLTLDSAETTSTTAAVAAVISDSAIADDAEIEFDLDTVTGTWVGLKCAIIHTH